MKLLYIDPRTASTKEYTGTLPPCFEQQFKFFATKGARISVSIQKIDEQLAPLTNRMAGETLPFITTKLAKLEGLPLGPEAIATLTETLVKTEINKLNNKRSELLDIKNKCYQECSQAIISSCSNIFRDAYTQLLQDVQVAAVFKFLLFSQADSLLLARKQKLEAQVKKKLAFQKAKEDKDKALKEKLGSNEDRIKRLEAALEAATKKISKLSLKPKPKPKSTPLKPKPKTFNKPHKSQEKPKNAKGLNASHSANPPKRSKRKRQDITGGAEEAKSRSPSAERTGRLRTA